MHSVLLNGIPFQSLALILTQDNTRPISSNSSRPVSPDSELSYFDWSEDSVCPMLLELRMGNLDMQSTNYVYSMQISPIELEFDHNQAALGELWIFIYATEPLIKVAHYSALPYSGK